MDWMQTLRNWTADRRRWTAVLLLGVFLSVFVLALNEALHREVHPDACKPDHQCAVTMLHSGQVEMPVFSVTPVFTKAGIFFLRPVEIIVVRFFDFSLPPSCGPPSMLS
jgi:hypothetical protein